MLDKPAILWYNDYRNKEQGNNPKENKTMRMYEIEYQRTGTTATMKKENRSKVIIFSCDLVTDNFDELCKEFEKIAAENWHTYETRYAITNINITNL